jgi:ABC-type branched-subunit amino acid transport system substrate-binding protein
MLACLAVLAVIALVLTGCGSGDDGAATGEDTGASEPIVVGAAQGFTGFMVTWDVPVYNAALLAIEDINADGGVLGRQVKMIDADTKSDVSLASIFHQSHSPSALPR